MDPCEWVQDWSTFGQLDVESRIWRPPAASDEPKMWAKFRGAVVQNAYCVHLRDAKNKTVRADQQGKTRRGMDQRFFAALDDRPNAKDLWNDVLCGHRSLGAADIAVIVTHLPGAVPTPQQLQVFLAAATQPGWTATGDWSWPDRCGRSMSMRAREIKRERVKRAKAAKRARA